MAKQQQIATVKKFIDEVVNKGNVSALDQVVTPDVKLYDPSAQNCKPGIASLKEREAHLKKAFPNRMCKIQDIFATEDNRVIVYWSVQGAHKGELHDLPATGKNFNNITGISVYTLKNDKISEIHQNWDRLGLLEQLGAVERVTAVAHM